ncbi:hypothetical protein [Terrisporobacter petrolearius]|nr:hypothetical protein [Terrisporobacter petrolearius]
MVNLSDLKSNVIRNTIDVDINGELQEIVVLAVNGDYDNINVL